MGKRTESSEDLANWQARHRARILSRLAPFLEHETIAEIIPSPIQGIFLRRNENVLELYCFDAETKALSQIMSRIDLTDPLFLHATYLQAAFLTAAWQDKPPERIYIAGFGGGRLAMLFRHCFPDIQIDGSELDPAILGLCESHFGLELEYKHDVRIADSADDLANRDGEYDIIILDTFSADGLHPGRIGASTFLETCREKLNQDGVLVTNLVEMDPLLEEKKLAVTSTFTHAYCWNDYKSHLVFGSLEKPDIGSLTTRAIEIEHVNNLKFDYANHGKRLRLLEKQQAKDSVL